MSFYLLQRRNDVVLPRIKCPKKGTCSLFQFPGGGGGGGGPGISISPNAGTSDGDRRLRFWSDERAAGRRTATTKRACLSLEEILDFDFRSSDNG